MDITLEVAAVCLCHPEWGLLTVRKRETTHFILPGGKIEPHESSRGAALRELREEVHLSLSPSDLHLLGIWQGDAANEPGGRIHATVYTAILNDRAFPGAEIVDIQWVPFGSPPPDNLAPLIKTFVLPELELHPARQGR